MPRLLDAREPDFATAFDQLVAEVRGTAADVEADVRAILDEVAAEGDRAVIRHTQRLDRFDIGAAGLRLDDASIERAISEVAAPIREALDVAAARISAFHELQQPKDIDTTDTLGVRLGQVWRPIEAVGLYVPGGTAAYPSSVLMNAIPARIAGVKRLVMAVPTPRGELNPLVLLAARLAGVDEVLRIGGAQAIGALAFGTETIGRVDKIVGPGNAWVAEAKRQVFGRVGIDMVAGPSEIVVVADGGQNPSWIAADLLSQAEHDVLAQAILITDTPALADAVARDVDRQLRELSRNAIAGESWDRFGAIIVVAHLEAAPPLIDRLAPEHLELLVADPRALAARIHHAGSVFLGAHTPEVIGDYVGGPNHVLPTGRSARFSSGLGVLDFMKRTTFLECTEAALADLGGPARILAEAEGLDAHARAITCRGVDES